MRTNIIYTGANKPIGKLVETSGQIRAFDMNGRAKGYYDKKSNRTMNANNSLFSVGNRVVGLI